jgi:hypothetical protein
MLGIFDSPSTPSYILRSQTAASSVSVPVSTCFHGYSKAQFPSGVSPNPFDACRALHDGGGDGSSPAMPPLVRVVHSLGSCGSVAPDHRSPSCNLQECVAAHRSTCCMAQDYDCHIFSVDRGRPLYRGRLLEGSLPRAARLPGYIYSSGDPPSQPFSALQLPIDCFGSSQDMLRSD